MRKNGNMIIVTFSILIIAIMCFVLLFHISNKIDNKEIPYFDKPKVQFLETDTTKYMIQSDMGISYGKDKLSIIVGGFEILRIMVLDDKQARIEIMRNGKILKTYWYFNGELYLQAELNRDFSIRDY